MYRTKQSDAAQLPLLLFFLFSTAGWLWEVLFVGLTTGMAVNRGLLHGPWLPIYGVGGVLILLLLQRFKGVLLFLLSALAGGFVEYTASVLLELLFHARWWDYSSWPWNLQGRACIGSVLAFGAAGWCLVRVLAPALERLLSSLPERVRAVLCPVLCLLFAFDAGASFAVPNAGMGISFPV